MKKILNLLLLSIALVTFSKTTFAGSITKDDVKNLVNSTANDIEQNSKATFEKIILGKAPYVNKENKSLYAFVYDLNVTIVAHPKGILVGRCFKGKPDATGVNCFRDKIITGALKNKTGWVTYLYKNPKDNKLYKKETYYQLVTDNLGKQYVVCAGRYIE